MKKVYGYIRVSTAKQGQGVSLIAQKDAIIRYAEQFNFEIVEWFEEKETAAKQGRPIFNAVMKLLKAKKVDGIIMHKIDRSARHLQDWVDIGNLIDIGVEVHFAHENLDMRARGGRLSADIQAVIAADYIRNLRQEAIKGLYGRLKQGIYPFQAPLGYLNNGKGKHKTLDPIRAPLVRKAFELYATQKYNLKTLVSKLNELGLTNTNNTKIKVSNLSKILNNPFYTGLIRIRKSSYNGGHAPLISPRLYREVQAILRGKTNQKLNKYEFKYRKLITCEHCGFSLVGEIQKGHTYYRCHTKGCITKSIREVTIENKMLKFLRSCQLYPQEYENLQKFLKQKEIEWETSQKEIEKSCLLQIGQMKQKLERLTDFYLEGTLNKEVFERRNEQLLLELKSKENSQRTFSKGKEQILNTVRNFLELGKTLIKSYEIGILEEKRELVETVTSNLVVHGKNLIISMKSPFEELKNRWDVHYGAHDRDTLRKMNSIVSNETTPCSLAADVITMPLPKEKLKDFLDLIIKVVSELPESKSETNYV